MKIILIITIFHYFVLLDCEVFNVLILINPTEIIDFHHVQFIKSRKCVI